MADPAHKVVKAVVPAAGLGTRFLPATKATPKEMLPVVDKVDLPPFDNSSMDGYAVRVNDVAGASDLTPVRLPVVGDIAAGSQAAYSVQPGLSTRIMTGAPVPAGAEAGG